MAPGEHPDRVRWPVQGYPVLVLIDGTLPLEIVHALGRRLVLSGATHAVIGDPELSVLRGGYIPTYRPPEGAAA